MSEMEKILTAAAIEGYETIFKNYYTHGSCDDDLRAVLVRRLLPLLEAGEALASPYADNIDALLDDYRAAKRKVLEETR